MHQTVYSKGHSHHHPERCCQGSMWKFPGLGVLFVSPVRVPNFTGLAQPLLLLCLSQGLHFANTTRCRYLSAALASMGQTTQEQDHSCLPGPAPSWAMPLMVPQVPQLSSTTSCRSFLLCFRPSENLKEVLALQCMQFTRLSPDSTAGKKED